MPTSFQGAALFSPFVPQEVQDQWGSYGGGLASGQQRASYVFCCGRNDPWLSSLHRRAVPVFHMDWISDSILWNIALPVKGYILDGRCDDHANTLPSEDSQATVCVPEESQTSGQDEQQPPSSQNPTCSVTESTCTATTTTVKRKGPPEVDVQPPVRPHKNVRISEFSCGAEGVPASTPHVKRSKKKEQRQQGTPYLDLRKMTSSKKATSSALEYEALDASGARKIAAASAELCRAMESSGDHPPRIPVSLALDILRDIPVDDAVRFKPGQTHKGNRFSCQFVSQKVVSSVKK